MRLFKLLHGTEFTPCGECARRLEHGDGGRIGRVFVHIDDPRHDRVGIAQRFAEEVRGRSRMAVGLCTNSRVVPAESRTLYKYIQVPRTFTPGRRNASLHSSPLRTVLAPLDAPGSSKPRAAPSVAHADLFTGCCYPLCAPALYCLMAIEVD